MPALTSEASSMLTNPLDLMEQVIGGHGWTFERCTPTEMAAEAPSRWCDYGLFFSWSAELGAILFTCAFDLKAAPTQYSDLYELIGLANEQIWVGHFSWIQKMAFCSFAMRCCYAARHLLPMYLKT